MSVSTSQGQLPLKDASKLLLRAARQQNGHEEEDLSASALRLVEACTSQLKAARLSEAGSSQPKRLNELAALDCLQHVLAFTGKTARLSDADAAALARDLCSHWTFSDGSVYGLVRDTMRKLLGQNSGPLIIDAMLDYVDSRTLERKSSMSALELLVGSAAIQSIDVRRPSVKPSWSKWVALDLLQLIAAQSDHALVTGRAVASIIDGHKDSSDSLFWVKPLFNACLQGDKATENVARYVLRPLFQMAEHWRAEVLKVADEWTTQARSQSVKESLANASKRKDRMLALRLSFDIESLAAGNDESELINQGGEVLETALQHRNMRLQMLAGRFLVASPSEASPVSARQIDLLTTYFKHIVRRQVDEARMEFQAVLGKLIGRLRRSTKRARLRGEQAYLLSVENFVKDLALIALDGLHLHIPHRIQNNSLHLYDLLLQGGFDRRYRDTSLATEGYSSYRRATRARLPRAAFGDTVKGKENDAYDWPISVPLVTAEATQLLLFLLNSTYVPLRSLASEILTSFEAPWPTYGSQGNYSRISVELLQPALRKMLSGREAEASTGAAVVALIWRKYIHELGCHIGMPVPEAIQRGAAPGDLDDFISALFAWIEHNVSLFKANVGRAATAAPMHGLILGLRNLLFTAFGPLVSSGQSEKCKTYLHRAKKLCHAIWEATAPVLSSTAADEALDLADHEEARADATQTALHDDDDGDDDETALAHGTGGVRAKVVLSSCWRAMKEVGDLFETVLRLPCDLGLEHVRQIWTPDDLESFGRMYTTWTTEIRHRGAYMAMFPCYSRCCQTLLKLKGWPEVQSLPIRWLDAHIDDLISKKISFTRRSAGIPFAICGILNSVVTARPDRFDAAIDRLFTIVESEAAEISDESRVHALNTFRTILSDSKMASQSSQFIERGFLVSLRMFWAPSWICRNAALMCYAALVIKILGPRNVNIERTPETLAARRFMSEFFEQYPRLHPMLLEVLQQKQADLLSPSSTSDAQSSLYSIYLLLSLLQTPNAKTTDYAKAFLPGVLATAKSSIWKIRAIGADALTGILAEDEAVLYSSKTVDRLATVTGDELHGNLLQLRALCQGFPSVRVALQNSSSLSDIVFGTSSWPARRAAADTLLLCESSRSQAEAISLLQRTDFVKMPREPQVRPFFACLLGLAALDPEPDGAKAAVRHCFASKWVELREPILLKHWSDARFQIGEAEFTLMCEAALDRKTTPNIRILALDALSSTASIDRIDRHLISQLAVSIEHEPSVPVRIRMLPLLTKWTMQSQSDPDDTKRTGPALLPLIDSFTHEDSSIDARRAGAQSLVQLASALPSDPSTASLIRRMLQDDFQPIREIMHDGLPESGDKDELAALSLVPVSYDESHALAEFEKDMNELANPNSLLFAVEPANIYLDPTLNVPSSSGATYSLSFVREALARLDEIITDPDAIVKGGPFGPASDRGLAKWAPRLLNSLEVAEKDTGDLTASANKWMDVFRYVCHL